MTRKRRTRPAAKRNRDSVKDEMESPEKKVKFMNEVSNEDVVSDTENQDVPQVTNARPNVSTRQRALKEKIKIKIEPPPEDVKPKRILKKKKVATVTDKDESVQESEGDTSKLEESSSASKVSEEAPNAQSVTFLISQETDAQTTNEDILTTQEQEVDETEYNFLLHVSNDNNVKAVAESLVPAEKEEENLADLLSGLEECTPVEVAETNIVLSIEGSPDYVVLPSTEENLIIENVHETVILETVVENVVIETATVENMEIPETENIVEDDTIQNMEIQEPENVENQGTKCLNDQEMTNVTLSPKKDGNQGIDSLDDQDMPNVTLSPKDDENKGRESLIDQEMPNVISDPKNDESQGTKSPVYQEIPNVISDPKNDESQGTKSPVHQEIPNVRSDPNNDESLGTKSLETEEISNVISDPNIDESLGTKSLETQEMPNVILDLNVVESLGTKSLDNQDIQSTILGPKIDDIQVVDHQGNEEIQNIVSDHKSDENQGQNETSNISSQVDSLPEKIHEEVVKKVAKKLKSKKTKKTIVKSSSLKTKEKGKSQRKKPAQPATPPTIPIVQHTVNKEDEITCEICEQNIQNHLIHHDGQPIGGFEEGTAILDSKLLLFDGDEADVSTEDVRSYNKITSFSVYCKNGHLCQFDSGLIEKDAELYFSGYVKPIHSEDPSPENGVPGKKFGPIVWWWMTGFDIGEQPTVGITTELGDYICMEPSAEYAPFMRSVMTKIYISKIVIEFLIYEPNASYEDLLAKLQTTSVPNNFLENFSEDTLLHYASFICDQVITFDDTAKPKEKLLVTSPCIRRLIDLAGIKFEVDTSSPPLKARQIFRERQFEHKIDYREKRLRQVAEDKKENSGASELIDILLPTHEKFLTSRIAEPWRCGVCDRCSRGRCRECNACNARNYEACYQRRCFNREIMEEKEEDAQDETDFSEMKAEDSFSLYRVSVRPLARHTYDIAWGTKPLFKDGQNRTYYGSVYLNCSLISPGDFIDVRSSNPGVPPQIMKVSYMYEDDSGHPRIHASFFWSGKYTVLGDISDRKELFFINRCIDVEVHCIVKKVQVLVRTDANLDNSMVEDPSQYPYICQRSYDPSSGTFKDLESQDEDRDKYGAPYRYCWVCDRNNGEREEETPAAFDKIEENGSKIIYRSVRYNSEEYHVGSAVYLKPKSLYFMYPMMKNSGHTFSKIMDEEKHPEFYRKAKDEDSTSKQDLTAPFDIGYVIQIFTEEGKLLLRVTKMYRPENTSKGDKISKNADVNELYWSDEDQIVPFSYVIGKCYLTHLSSITDVAEWSSQGPDRFYFSKIYKGNVIDDIGIGEYGCPIKMCDAPVYPEVKLSTLNLFAGCGGLALGLQQAGAADVKWAIEPDKAAAATFKLNNPNTAVFVGTCVEMMEKISKKDFKVNDDRLPKKGNVDLICATLPSECWRSIDSVNAFKSSNITTFLMYLTYYQPRYFVLEADDILLKRSIVLKLVLASLIRLGYQVAFDLVQVGNFGAPQNRYRTVIIGASRGYALPDSPRNQHVFSKSSSSGHIVIDSRLYERRNWKESAPYKATTVQDAILDLAAIDMKQNGEATIYTAVPVSFYHRMMRRDLTEPNKNKVFNHIAKDLGPLVEGRMSQVPFTAGADWRDLPNIELRLRDKTYTNKLVYKYDDPELGMGKQGQPRGVCSCSVGKRCKPSNVQENTLIPWHLVHSGKRHGHWAGLYGKLQWDGVFVGTSTNPEPLAKKVPVVHPSKSRVLSVRESARAQGFPDSFIFAGDCHAMYRQIGLATSPLLARAIGREIAKSAAQNADQ